MWQWKSKMTPCLAKGRLKVLHFEIDHRGSTRSLVTDGASSLEEYEAMNKALKIIELYVNYQVFTLIEHRIVPGPARQPSAKWHQLTETIWPMPICLQKLEKRHLYSTTPPVINRRLSLRITAPSPMVTCIYL